MRIDWALGRGWCLYRDDEELPFMTVQGNMAFSGPVELRSNEKGHGWLYINVEPETFSYTHWNIEPTKDTVSG